MFSNGYGINIGTQKTGNQPYGYTGYIYTRGGCQGDDNCRFPLEYPQQPIIIVFNSIHINNLFNISSNTKYEI